MAIPDGFQSVLQDYYTSRFLTEMRRLDSLHCPCEPQRAPIPIVGLEILEGKGRYFANSQILSLIFLIPKLHLQHLLHLYKSLILFHLASEKRANSKNELPTRSVR